MTPFRRVLLTGATGFFGLRLLTELLRSGASEVCCLLRDGGKERLRGALSDVGVWQDEWTSRITALAGDLARPELGLGRGFPRLAGEVDAIFHNGAKVSQVLGLRHLRAVNVSATQELLRVAEAGGVPFHFISSLRLFEHRLDGVPIRESDRIDMRTATRNGYVHSKAISERLVQAAASRGAPTAIYRPGLLCGDGCAGAPNVRDVVSLIVRDCVSLGAAPTGPLQFNTASVAHAARAAVSLARAHGASGAVWHLVHDRPTVMVDVFEVLRVQGYRMEMIPFAKWIRRLRDMDRKGRSVLKPFLPNLTPELPDRTAGRVHDSRLTRSALAALGVEHPQMDARFWENNIKGMAACGFIPLPATSQRSPRER